MKRTKWLAILLAVVLVLVPASSAFAASSQGVTVTAAPLYLSITINTATWTINDLGSGTESGLIEPATTYYSNPVDSADDTTPPSGAVLLAECYFTVTVGSGATTSDFTLDWGDFTGGGADMTNGNSGSAGATSFGAYGYYEGMTYPDDRVVIQSSGSLELFSGGLTADNTLGWGVEITTQDNAWSSGFSSSNTLTITASAS